MIHFTGHTKKYLLDSRWKLIEALQAVRDIHQKKERNGLVFCNHCVDLDDLDFIAVWPCRTIKALGDL